MRLIGLVAILLVINLVSAPFPTQAQLADKVRRIGFLSGANRTSVLSRDFDGFRKVSASTAMSRDRTCSLSGDSSIAGRMPIENRPISTSGIANANEVLEAEANGLTAKIGALREERKGLAAKAAA